MLYHRIRYEEFQVINTLTDCAQPCEYNEYRLAIIVIIITSIIIMSTGWPPRKVDPAFKLNISRSPLKRPPGLQLRSMRSFFTPGKIKKYPMMNIFLFTTLILSVGILLLLILAAFLVSSLASHL